MKHLCIQKQYKQEPRLEHFFTRSWEEKAAKRYADMLFKERKKLKSASDFKPPSIDNKTWARWKNDQECPDNKAVSARNSSNGRGGRDKAEATHIGGSVTQARTMRDLVSIQLIKQYYIELIYYLLDNFKSIFFNFRNNRKVKDPHLMKYLHEHMGSLTLNLGIVPNGLIRSSKKLM